MKTRMSSAAVELVKKLKNWFCDYRGSKNHVVYIKVVNRINTANLGESDRIRAIRSITRFLKI